jgi:ribonuclease J
MLPCIWARQRPEILEMIRKIHPDKLYPIHTTHKEKFLELADDGIEVIFPKKQEII